MRIPILIQAADGVLREGIAGLLGGSPDLQVLAADPAVDVAGAVTVVCLDELGDGEWPAELSGPRAARVVLVLSRMTRAELLDAVERGVTVVLWRREVTAERLVRAVRLVDRGVADLPKDLLGGLLAEVGRARRVSQGREPAAAAGLRAREVEVLRLLAEGLETREIAEKLSYSERTIKGVLHGLMKRNGLRNRAHAVAYAARAGYLR